MFEAVEQVVYTNPFTEERARLIRKLVPGLAAGDLAAQRDALAQVVAPRLERFPDPATMRTLRDADRRLVQSAWLYVCYHRHVPQIDDLIARQSRQAQALPAGHIADSVIAELVSRGFTEQAAIVYFALFFQLRRAFFFIVGSLPGQCESMRRLRHGLWNHVFTHDMRSYELRLRERMEDFSTLVLGETGTGKGQAAAAIGRSEFIPYLPDKRRFAANFAESFIAINLSQFPEALIESELFGHRKGAFTGAIEHHDGVLERCNIHGALFLDEIGEVAIPVQIKLLQVLQERIFSPLGSHEKKRFAGRVIAATNRPLGELRAGGRFRDDFYYRLCSDVIVLPTLRQRIEESPGELEELVELLVARITGEKDAALAAAAMQALERDVPRGYRWPGNVRELEQAVRRIVLSGSYRADTGSATASEEEALAAGVKSGELKAEELLARYCGLLYRRLGSYSEVATRAGLDRRTARKYVVAGRRIR